MRTGRYSRTEVEHLVEGFEELVEQKDVDHPRPRYIIHALLDMGRALPWLSLPERQVLFLMGTLGFSARQAAEILDVEFTKVWRRYQFALTNLTEVMSKGGK